MDLMKHKKEPKGSAVRKRVEETIKSQVIADALDVWRRVRRTSMPVWVTAS